jgi:hypothetical protein
MKYLLFLSFCSLFIQCKKEKNVIEEPIPVFTPYLKGKMTGFLNGKTYLGDMYCSAYGYGDNKRLIIDVATYSDNINYFPNSSFVFGNVPFKKGKYYSEIILGGNLTDSLEVRCNYHILYEAGHVLGPLYGQDSLYENPSITIDSINTGNKTVYGVINAHLRKVPHFADLDPSAPDSMNFVNCSFQVIVDEK